MNSKVFLARQNPNISIDSKIYFNVGNLLENCF